MGERLTCGQLVEAKEKIFIGDISREAYSTVENTTRGRSDRSGRDHLPEYLGMTHTSRVDALYGVFSWPTVRLTATFLNIYDGMPAALQ